MGGSINPRYRHLPIDTKHFKDLELEILGLFDNLDASLDGWLIKSENYQALNTVLPKFREKVKCVYIDPPYNTGNDEFIYRDQFRHSSWLTMMENRLTLARQFIGPSGLLFSSIDENEVSNLNSLLVELFGERVGNIVVRNNPKGRSQDRYFSTSHEYVVAFGKNQTSLAGLPKSEEQLSDYDQEDANGKYRSLELRNTHRQFNRETRPNLWFPLYCDPITSAVSLDKVSGYIEVFPVWNDGLQGCWTWGKKKAQAEQALLIGREVSPGRWKVYCKDYAVKNGAGATFIPKTIWDDGELRTDYAQKLLDDIFGKRVFQSPKAPALIQRLYELSPGDLKIVCDYFAGSGTTAHAIIDLSRKDYRRRKYLLVEMSDYLFSVMLERIKKISFSDKWKDGKAQEAGTGISHFCKYYQLEQYEDTLRHAKYDDADLFDDPNRDPYHQYVFLRDLKMLEALEVETQKNTVKVDLGKLYPPSPSPLSKGGGRGGIDVAETLSNLTGKWIKRITADSVEFEDGVVDTKNLDWKRIKPLIWW